MIPTSPTLHHVDAADQISHRRLSPDTPAVSAPCRINVLGSVGSGATLLGLALADILQTSVLDTDIFSWRPTHPPFQIRCGRDSRRTRLLDELAQHPRVIVCGSVVGWGEPLEATFDGVIALVPFRKFSAHSPRAPLPIRPRSDLGANRRHDQWLSECTCPVLRLDTALSPAVRVKQALSFIRLACHRQLSISHRSSPRASPPPMNSLSFPCSGYATVGGIVFFARMLDKIRLHAAGELPGDYNLGGGLDSRMCRFLHIDYAAVSARARVETDDAVVLEWCFAQGYRPAADDILYFNTYMTKRGWRDDYSPKLEAAKASRGWSDRVDLQTSFDLQDADEGRK